MTPDEIKEYLLKNEKFILNDDEHKLICAVSGGRTVMVDLASHLGWSRDYVRKTAISLQRYGLADAMMKDGTGNEIGIVLLRPEGKQYLQARDLL